MNSFLQMVIMLSCGIGKIRCSAISVLSASAPDILLEVLGG